MLDQQSELVRTTLVGSVSLADLARHARALATNRLLTVDQLVDGRMGSLRLSLDETREFADLMGSLRSVYGSARVAFVPGDAESHRFAERYREMGAGANPAFALFEDVPSAEVWLVSSRD